MTYSSLWETHRRATERHLPYGITQCYLPPHTQMKAPRLNPMQPSRPALVAYFYCVHCVMRELRVFLRPLRVALRAWKQRFSGGADDGRKAPA